MGLSLEDFDNIVRLQRPIPPRFSHGSENLKHTPVCIQRGHVRVEIPAFEFLESIKMISHKIGDAYVFGFAIAVPAAKTNILAEWMRFFFHARFFLRR